MQLLIKQIDIKTLVSGDKSARIVLETVDPEQIETLKLLASEMFINVEFQLPDGEKEIKQHKGK